MASTTFFFQECPTCGRHLRIRVEHLGRQMTCVHCSGILLAHDSVLRGSSEIIRIPSLLDRAEELLSLSVKRTLAEG